MFFEQLSKACKNKDKTVTAVAKELKISKSNVTNWKNGTTPNGDVVVRLSELLGVTADYLLKDGAEINFSDISEDEKELLNYYKELDDYGKGRVIGKAEELAEAARRKKALEAASKEKPNPKITPFPTPALPDDTEDEDEEEYIYIDFPDLPVSAGTGVYLNSDYTEPLMVPANDLTLKANYVLRVAGDSMQPRYYDGDIVLVKTQPSVEIGEVGIFIYNDEAYIKKFQGDRLVSLNPKYEDIPIKDPDSFYCKGKVIGILSIGNKG